MKKPKIRYYTIMFVPDGNGRTFYIKVNKYLVLSLFFLITILFVVSGFYIYKSAEIGAKIQLSYYLKEENIKLKEENKKLYRAVEKINSIEKTGTYLRKLASVVRFSLPEQQASTSQDILRKDSLEVYLESEQRLNASFDRLDNVDNLSKAVIASSIPSISPVAGWLTKSFDTQQNFEHVGLDFSAQEGSFIRATAPGIVNKVWNDSYLGLVVEIHHRMGYQTIYGHCKQIIVSQGEIVDRGQVIGFVGNTGRSSAPHCHYEVLKNGKNENPERYIFSFQ